VKAGEKISISTSQWLTWNMEYYISFSLNLLKTTVDWLAFLLHVSKVKDFILGQATMFSYPSQFITFEAT
jgi:hypothetical protein